MEKWNGQPIKERIQTDYSDAVDNSLNEDEEWKGACLYVYENNGWTIFEDLTGAYSSIEASNWLKFAGMNSFIFAGYNDAIPYGEMIALDHGEILKDFGDDLSDPEFCHDIGDEYQEIKDWTDVAAFVDDDTVYSDTGILIIC